MGNRTRSPKLVIVLLISLVFGTSIPRLVLADQNETATNNQNVLSQSSIALGLEHSCVVMTNGGVKCWGKGEDGQLGNGSSSTSNTPVVVTGLSNVIALTGGAGHTCALLGSGAVKCWGKNDDGQLGNGSTTLSNIPVDVIGLSSGVSAITAGDLFSCAIVANGGVKCWGNNLSGQLGDNSTTTSNVPVSVSGLSSGVSVISAGADHICAIVASSGAKCWGRNTWGQLGNGTRTHSSTPVNVTDLASGVSALASGFISTCAVLTVGTVKCWGDNSQSQLARDSATVSLSSIPLDVAGLTGVEALSSGDNHVCARLSGGAAKCWGRNSYGQLGDGSLTSSQNPVAVSGLSSGVAAISTVGDHTCALLTSGGLKCWGVNNRGQLGIGTIVNKTSPNDVTGLSSGVGATTTTTTAPPPPPPPTTITTTSTSSTTTTTTTPTSVNFVKIRRGSIVSGVALLKRAHIALPTGSRLTIKVRKPDASRCLVVKNGVQGLRTGSCGLDLSIRPKVGKPINHELTLTVVQ